MYPREEGNGGIRRRERKSQKNKLKIFTSLSDNTIVTVSVVANFLLEQRIVVISGWIRKGWKVIHRHTYILFRISFFAYLFFFSSRCLVLFHNIGREKTFSTSERNSRCLLPLMYMPGGGISVADNPVDVRLHLCPSGWPDSSRRVECKLRYLKSGCPLYLTRFSQWYSVLDLRGLFYRPLIYYQ